MRRYTLLMESAMTLIPAATVVVLRKAHAAAPQILLVRRNPELPVQGNAWVFPGGRIAPIDAPAGITIEAARACAVRETYEEAGLRLRAADLYHMAQWVTPRGYAQRFDTWFFMAVGTQTAVRIDGREIVDARWQTAEQALAAHHRMVIRLSAPTFVTLSRLALLGDMAAIMKAAQTEPPAVFKPRRLELPDGDCTVYQEDIAYHDGDLTRSGPRHRLWMRTSGWHYECRC